MPGHQVGADFPRSNAALRAAGATNCAGFLLNCLRIRHLLLRQNFAGKQDACFTKLLWRFGRIELFELLVRLPPG
jgi:hypothetical protein